MLLLYYIYKTGINLIQKEKLSRDKGGRDEKIEGKGITLITLVITIIVLLILAGVTIGILMGENGVLGKGQKASEETDKQTATEKINLKITNKCQIYKI